MNNAFYVNTDAYFRSKLAFGLVQLNPVVIGTLQAPILQSDCAIAIGEFAGQYNQGECAIAIGAFAGQTQQRECAIAIGAFAGQTQQRECAIAIGAFAGQTGQHANSIVLNASGVPLDTLEEKSCYIAPLRDAPGDTLVQYRTLAKELTTSNTINGYISSWKDYTIPPPFPQDTVEQIFVSSTLNKWNGGVLAPNGKIYCIPWNATSVLIIDPATNNFDTSSITGLVGVGKWRGGVLAPNGKIYCIPANATSVLIIDPKTDTVDTTTISGLSSAVEKWFSGVLAPNGKIYGIPLDSESVLIIDPVNDTADTTTISGLGNGSKWRGGVLAPDGKIYCIPQTASNVMIIDPETNTVDTTSIQGLVGLDKWRTGALAPNGLIYGIPVDSSSVLIIDPTSPVSSIPGVTAATANYTDGTKILNCPGATFATPGSGQLVIGDNLLITTASQNYTGYVESITDNQNVVLIYALGSNLGAGTITGMQKTRKADITTLTGFTGSNKFFGSCLSLNGKIYGIPWDATYVLIIDPTTNTADTTTISVLSSPQKWRGVTLAPNGFLYGIPRDSDSVLVIRPGLPIIPDWPLQAYFNKL